MEKEKPLNTTQIKSGKQRKLLRKKGLSKRRSGGDDDHMSALPPAFQNKLQGLFLEIEKEFEKLHTQNSACKYYHMKIAL